MRLVPAVILPSVRGLDGTGGAGGIAADCLGGSGDGTGARGGATPSACGTRPDAPSSVIRRVYSSRGPSAAEARGTLSMRGRDASSRSAVATRARSAWIAPSSSRMNRRSSARWSTSLRTDFEPRRRAGRLHLLRPPVNGAARLIELGLHEALGDRGRILDAQFAIQLYAFLQECIGASAARAADGMRMVTRR